MQRKTFGVAIVLATLWLPRLARGQEPVLTDPGLRQYVDRVLSENDGYRAAGLRVEAAAERIAPAGSLPDPTLTFGVTAVPAPSFGLTSERMTRLPLGVRQRFPGRGKRRAATELAQADSMVWHELRGATEHEIASTAARFYYELLYAETALQIWRSRLTLAEQAIDVTRVRYETGAAPQTDLLRARLRLAELREKGEALAAIALGSRARAEALIGESDTSVSTTALLTDDGDARLDIFPVAADSTNLLLSLRQNNPIARVAAARHRRAERNARVFDLAGRPDFTVALESGFRFGGRQPLLTALVGVSIPMWSRRKQQPEARAAHLDVDAEERNYGDVIDRQTGELRNLVAAIGGLQERTRLTSTDVIPLAEAATTSALQRYTVGDVEFTTVLDTQDDLFQARLRLARLITDYAIARALLAALVGEEWYK